MGFITILAFNCFFLLTIKRGTIGITKEKFSIPNLNKLNRLKYKVLKCKRIKQIKNVRNYPKKPE